MWLLKNMFLTTLDILYFVLAIGIGLICIFICWFTFYLVMMVRDLRKVTKEVREEIGKFVGFGHRFCDKFEHATSYFIVLVDVAKELMHYFVTTKKEKKSKK
jgi:hypothetical protein